MNVDPSGMVPAQFLFLFGFVLFVLSAVVHLVFAFAVKLDASRLRRQGVGPALVGPGVWMLVTLLLGVFGAVIYWAMHHSALAPAPADRSRKGREEGTGKDE